MTPQDEDVDESEGNINGCGCPCHPDDACERCAAYWKRMIAEGLWDEHKSQWTDKGFSDIARNA
jgi:hypothetical protein